MHRFLPFLLIALLVGCSSKSDDPSIPPNAAIQKSYLETGVGLMFPGLGRVDALLPFLMNPGSPGASGIEFQLNTAPEAPPNSYTFSIPVDGDGDGGNETTITGSCRLSGDPATAAVGFSGSIDQLVVSSVGGLGDFSGAFEFALVAEGTHISGAGTFNEAISGNTTSLSVEGDHPLLVRVATGAPGSVPNACAYSLEGTVNMDVVGPLGALASDLTFSPGQSRVSVTHGLHTDSNDHETTIPDSQFDIPCGGGSLQDWVGTFQQDWACLPSPDAGQARLTVTVKNATTIQIVDHDPPESEDGSTYTATMLPGNPHIVRGFFLSGGGGRTYREDFTWTLAANRNSFSDVSVYVYQSGGFPPGGLCSGHAVRQQ